MVSLAESKGLSAAETTLAGLESTHLAFTGALVLLIRHFHILGRKASATESGEEAAVASIQNIDLGIRQARIEFSIHGTILSANMSSHQRSTVGRVFTMKDEQGSTADGSLEQLGGEKLFVIVVDSTLDVATIVLVLETAVNDHFVIKLVIEFPVENIQHGALGDAWNGVSEIVREEVRHNRFVVFLNVHDRLERRWHGFRSLRLCIHDVVRVLEHAQRAAKLFAGSQERVRLPSGVACER